MSRTRIAVLGAGSWGTALAVHLASLGHAVRLWARDPAHAAALGRDRENVRYLPGVELPESVRATADMGEALEGAVVVVGVVPSTATADVAERAAGLMAAAEVWVSATKGLHRETRRRISEVVRERIPAGVGVAVLSGPSFATEVAAGLPTAVVVASESLDLARRLQETFSGPTFRAYASDDVIGVEIGGAVKNVIAIAAGMVSGLGLGHDAQAALVTRGLSEIGGLARALGARPETLAGLAGLGDLVLTCTGSLSRNRRLGEAVAGGKSPEEALAGLGQVAEGMETTRQVLELAEEAGLEMPITEAVAEVLAGRLGPAEAVQRLMSRALKDEG